MKKTMIKPMPRNVPRSHLKIGERNGIMQFLCKTNPAGVSKYTTDEKEVTCKNCAQRMKTIDEEEIKILNGQIDFLKARNLKLERVMKAAASVLSEEGIVEYLSSYVMGVEFVARLEEARIK